MPEVQDFLRRVIDRTHLTREKFVENNVPTNFASIRVVPFFGDERSEFVLATLLLHRLFKADKSEYLILIGWPGHSGLFPYVDEYWSMDDDVALADLVRGIDGFNNRQLSSYEKILLRYFDNVASMPELAHTYYNQGLTKDFFNEYRTIEYRLPAIPSVSVSWAQRLGRYSGKLLALHPTKYVHAWSKGRQVRMLIEEEFWVALVGKLIDNAYMPVLLNTYAGYDLSPHFSTSCIYCSERNIMSSLSVMRASDCVLDIFNGLSRYALIARCPFYVCDERQRYFNTREYELDDLCGQSIEKNYMFSFASLLRGDVNQITQGVINRLESFLPTLDKDNQPSASELSESLTYEQVRQREMLRIGNRFFAPPHLSKREESIQGK